jgi:hypothetical protein
MPGTHTIRMRKAVRENDAGATRLQRPATPRMAHQRHKPTSAPRANSAARLAATSDEVKDLHREAGVLTEVVAELTLEAVREAATCRTTRPLSPGVAVRFDDCGQDQYEPLFPDPPPVDGRSPSRPRKK